MFRKNTSTLNFEWQENKKKVFSITFSFVSWSPQQQRAESHSHSFFSFPFIKIYRVSSLKFTIFRAVFHPLSALNSRAEKRARRFELIELPEHLLAMAKENVNRRRIEETHEYGGEHYLDDVTFYAFAYYGPKSLFHLVAPTQRTKKHIFTWKKVIQNLLQSNSHSFQSNVGSLKKWK